MEFMSQEINELAGALAQAQSEISPAKKDAENPHLKSKYADLASIWNACREALNRNGIAVTQIPVEAPAGHVAIRSLLIHKSGQWIGGTLAIPFGEARGLNMAQAYGSVLSYAKRYALAALVGVVAEDDDDGASAGAPTPRRQERPQPIQDAPQVRQAPTPAPTPKAITAESPADPSPEELLVKLETTVKAEMTQAGFTQPQIAFRVVTSPDAPQSGKERWDYLKRLRANVKSAAITPHEVQAEIDAAASWGDTPAPASSDEAGIPLSMEA